MASKMTDRNYEVWTISRTGREDENGEEIVEIELRPPRNQNAEEIDMGPGPTSARITVPISKTPTIAGAVSATFMNEAATTS